MNKRYQRLFLTLWPDDDVRHQIANHAALWSWTGGCVLYAPDDSHLTLHFIGNVEVDRVAHIAASVAVPFKPFELVLDQPRLWSHGLAVLCASEVPSSLRELHERLGTVLGGLELAVEARAYQPHVTLARRAGAAIPPTTAAHVTWQVRGYALAVSTGDKDQRYRIVRRYL